MRNLVRPFVVFLATLLSILVFVVFYFIYDEPTCVKREDRLVRIDAHETWSLVDGYMFPAKHPEMYQVQSVCLEFVQ